LEIPFPAITNPLSSTALFKSSIEIIPLVTREETGHFDILAVINHEALAFWYFNLQHPLCLRQMQMILGREEQPAGKWISVSRVRPNTTGEQGTVEYKVAFPYSCSLLVSIYPFVLINLLSTMTFTCIHCFSNIITKNFPKFYCPFFCPPIFLFPLFLVCGSIFGPNC
jgi:hypothetical protein